MNGPKPVCTLATNKTNQSNPPRLRRVGFGGGLRCGRSPAGSSEGDAISSIGGCGADLRSGLPTGRRDGLADRGGAPGECFYGNGRGSRVLAASSTATGLLSLYSGAART
jgi:hypothetical protein